VTKEIENRPGYDDLKFPAVITAVRNRKSIIFRYCGKQEERIIVKINDFILETDFILKYLRRVWNLPLIKEQFMALMIPMTV
jgi:hypothetical protein